MPVQIVCATFEHSLFLSVCRPVVWGISAWLLCWPLLPQPFQELLLSQVGFHLNTFFSWKPTDTLVFCLGLTALEEFQWGATKQSVRHHLLSAVDQCLASDTVFNMMESHPDPPICSDSSRVHVCACVCMLPEGVSGFLWNTHISVC